MDRSHRPWTEDDIVKLRELAQKYPATTIARQLGRSIGAVSAKARALKLSLRMKRPTRKRPTHKFASARTGYYEVAVAIETSLEVETLKAGGMLPMILHWEFGR
jgi:hypothetical protein